MTAGQTFRVRRISGTISTDDIIPARYKHMYTDPAKLAPHLFDAYKPGFVDTLEPGDALVGDEIFGIGSSREQAVTALMASGLRLVLAPRFGRILFRNCWNLGLPAIEVDTRTLPDGGRIEVDLHQGVIRSAGAVLVQFGVPPTFLLDMVDKGGLLREVESSVAREKESENAETGCCVRRPGP